MTTKLRICAALIFALVLLSLVACSSGQTYKFKYESSPQLQNNLKVVPDYPPTSFAVLSDPHIYDNSLGTEGKAFETYLSEDRKLLRESSEIMQAAVGAIESENVSFVLVPGDMTKDGELICHELAATYLRELEASGKQVYVIPGNHDINNGYSARFIGDTAERVPNITSSQFVEIYGDFGYKEALYRDSASLSYVAEPQPGLWLLALDGCRYAENVPGEIPVTDGKFSQSTVTWIEDMLGKAAIENKAVIVMVHHGVVEHYVGQEKNFGEYLLDDYPEISKMFATYNARLVFTGHYHAQDITESQWQNPDKFVFDVETGSFVTYPSPYRVVTIDASQSAVIKTGHVESIPSHPNDFQQYARTYVLSGIQGIATGVIMKYKVNRVEAEKLAGQVAQAFEAHYAGDEVLPAGQEPLQTIGLSLPGWLVVQFRKGLVVGLWHDLPPADNNVTINLKTGDWQ